MSRSDRPEKPASSGLPSYLKGLELPVATDEAYTWAKSRGASAEALEYLESLPSAVFTSEEGLRRAFEAFESGEAEIDRDHSISKDGISS